MPAIVQEPEMITATREQPTPASIQEQSATSDELKDVPKKMTAIAPSDQSKSTLFVSALPFDATTADLMAFFAEVGPIRSAFVIKKKSPAVVSEESTPLEPDLTETTAVNPGLETAMNNGCGYVQFALPEDAARAIKDLKKVKFQGKRTLRIQFALKKSVAVERKKTGIPVTKDVFPAPIPRKSVQRTSETAAPIKAFPCRIDLSGLAPCLSKKQLYKKVRKFGDVKEIEFEDGKTEATIVYVSKKDGENAIKHLHEHSFKGSKLEAKLSVSIAPTRSRIIVRNLHFSVDEPFLRKLIIPFGTVLDVLVPKRDDGKPRGFAFIEFGTRAEGEKAMTELNGVKVRGRELTLSWAVSKKEHEEQLAKLTAQDEDSDEENMEETAPTLAQEQSEEEENVAFDANQDVLNEKSADAGGEKELGDRDDATLLPQSGLLRGTTLFLRNVSFDTTEEDIRKTFSKFGKLRYARITKDPVTGHSRGTGFVCFFSEQDSRRCLEEYDEFQKMSFLDPDSPNAVPLGKKKKGDMSGNSVLVPEPTKMESESPFYLDGRAIDISEALSRSEASQVASDRKVRQRSGDKRNMYLMREGVIFPDSDAAKNMAPLEVSRRQKSYSERKRLLSLNPNLFISKCRLSVRNLNLKVDDKLLRKVALLSVKEFWKEVASGSREGLEEEVLKEASEARYDPRDTKKTAVKQAKVVRSTDRIDPITKVGRSKGYGFIEFTRHSDALVCLRWLNNSPTAFKVVSEDDGEAPTENPSQMNRQRPIVEFAIENQMVVKRRADRQKNGKVSNDKTGSKADSETGPGKNKASKRKREGDDTVDTKNPKQMKSAKTEKGKGPCNKKIDDRKSADRDSTKVPSQKASKSLKDSEQKKPLLLGTSKLDFNTKASTSKAAGGEKKASKNAPKPAKIDLQLPAADVNKWISK